MDNYDKILEIDENDIDALIGIGILYSNKYRKTKKEEDFKNALYYHNKILEIYKNDIYALNNTKKEKYFNKHLHDYYKALEKDKNYAYTFK